MPLASKTNTIICQYCGKEFKQIRHWQKFCSVKHRSLYHNEKKAEELQQMLDELTALKLRNERVKTGSSK